VIASVNNNRPKEVSKGGERVRRLGGESEESFVFEVQRETRRKSSSSREETGEREEGRDTAYVYSYELTMVGTTRPAFPSLLIMLLLLHGLHLPSPNRNFLDPVTMMQRQHTLLTYLTHMQVNGSLFPRNQ
jgi:hypothetical protein